MIAPSCHMHLGDPGFITGLPGHWEVIIIILAILLLFGGKKLPELARGLGRGLRTFKKELSGIESELNDQDSADRQQDDQQKPQVDQAKKAEEPKSKDQD